MEKSHTTHEPASQAGTEKANCEKQGFRIPPTPRSNDVVVADPMENTQDPPDFEVREAPPLKSLFAEREAPGNHPPPRQFGSGNPSLGLGNAALTPPPPRVG